MAAPLLTDYLSDESRQRFEDVQRGLTALQIPFSVNPYLVRGLDYYCHTAFEIMTHHIHTDYIPGETEKKMNDNNTITSSIAITSSSFASQSTILAGGRYDGLCEKLGGPPLPAIGWAAGVDRLVLLMQAVHKGRSTKSTPTIAVIAAGDGSSMSVLSSLQLHLRRLCSSLRAAGYIVYHCLEKAKIGKQLSWAAKQNVTISLIVGEKELSHGVIQVKDMRNKEQQTVQQDQLIPYIQTLLDADRGTISSPINNE